MGVFGSRRIGEIDLPNRLSSHMPVWATQIIVALGCTSVAFLVRELVDMALPGAGPFALTFPFVLIATLFARWQSGLLALFLCALFAWYFVLPLKSSFNFAVQTDGPRVFINFASGLIVVLVAELFRRAVQLAIAERDGRIEERDLYLQEFDHRVKNNFATVVSLLSLQRQRVKGDEAKQALDEAQQRVNSIAQAHVALYRGDDGVVEIDMEAYLSRLCAALTTAHIFDHRFKLECHADAVRVPRDQAIAIGLLTNELVTNAFKHAFVDRDRGQIYVNFRKIGSVSKLIVGDDGVGIGAAPAREGSLGQKLIRAFAAQAEATLETESTGDGSRFVFTMGYNEVVATA